MPSYKLQIMKSEKLIQKIVSHIEDNKENLNPEVAENLLNGDNGINFVSGLIDDINSISKKIYEKNSAGHQEIFNDIKKSYYSNIYKSLLNGLTRFKKEYIKSSNSKELLSYLEVLETRLRDDAQVISKADPSVDEYLQNAVEKYTAYPNGYSYETHMEKRKRAAKRADQLTSLSKDRNEASAIKQLSDKINTYKTEDKLLTSDDAKELISLYAEAAVEMKSEYDKVKNNPEQAEMYKKMMKKFSKDYTALHKYKNKLDKAKEGKTNLMTVSEFFDTSRTRVVKLHDTDMAELSKSGAGQSIRYKIDFKVDDEPIEGASKGDVVTGYFTPDKVYDPNKKDTAHNPGVDPDSLISEDAEKDIINYLLAKYPQEADFIKSFPANANVHAFIGTSYDKILRNEGDAMCTENSVIDAVINLKEKYLDCPHTTNTGVKTIIAIGDNETRLNAYIEYTGLYLKHQLADRINKGRGIDRGAALGKRNALASALAEVLGCSDVLAFSEKMKIEAMENGKKTVKTGVMMMPAKGIDMKNVGSNSAFNNFTHMSMEENPGFVKNVAMLQFLDYLILNTDRHNANYLYQFDKKGKLIALQGIDNDTSCSSRKDAHSLGFGTLFKDLRIIPKSMADAVKAMKPEAYEVLLQGYDLNDAEIKNMKNVFIEAQKQIARCEKAYEGTEPGFLDKDMPRIVPDEDMGKYYVNEQLAHVNASKHSKSNTFGLLTFAIGDRFKSVANAMENDSRKCTEIACDLTRARLDRSPGSLYDSLAGFKKLHKDFDKKNIKKAGTFENVIATAEKFFDPKKKNPRFISSIGNIELRNDDNNVVGFIIPYEKGKDYSSYKKTLTTALDAANSYLQENSELVMDYQMCKAEIDLYKKEGDAEKLKIAEGELKILEQDPNVQKYKYAVKLRDKITDQLDKCNKLNDTMKDLMKAADRYDEMKKYPAKDDYLSSEFRQNARNNIRQLESRNKLKDPDAPAANAQAVAKIEPKKVEIKKPQ